MRNVARSKLATNGSQGTRQRCWTWRCRWTHTTQQSRRTFFPGIVDFQMERHVDWLSLCPSASHSLAGPVRSVIACDWHPVLSERSAFSITDSSLDISSSWAYAGRSE